MQADFSSHLERLLDEDALNRMQERATPQAIRLQRSTLELPFAVLKYHIFGQQRMLLRGTQGAQIEIKLALMGHNLKWLIRTLEAAGLTIQPTSA